MGTVSVTNGQCPRADDKLVRAKYWMFFLQILFMSDDSPDSRCDYTPPLSNIS